MCSVYWVVKQHRCIVFKLPFSAFTIVHHLIYLNKVFSCLYKSELDCAFVPELALDQKEDSLAQEARQITG